MKLTKIQLETKVDEQNDWLGLHTEKHPMHKMVEHRRNYYIQKLNEMDENNLTHIEL